MYHDGSYRVDFGDHLTDIAIPPKLTSIALASKNTTFAFINSDEARSTEIYLQTRRSNFSFGTPEGVSCARGGCRKVSGWGHYCYGTITTIRPGESHKHDGGVNLSRDDQVSSLPALVMLLEMSNSAGPAVHYRSSVGRANGDEYHDSAPPDRSSPT